MLNGLSTRIYATLYSLIVASPSNAVFQK